MESYIIQGLFKNVNGREDVAFSGYVVQEGITWKGFIEENEKRKSIIYGIRAINNIDFLRLPINNEIVTVPFYCSKSNSRGTWRAYAPKGQVFFSTEGEEGELKIMVLQECKKSSKEILEMFEQLSKQLSERDQLLKDHFSRYYE